MFNSYFNFSCSPFENILDQRFLFLSEGHQEVIGGLLYFVKEKKGFALVCGDVGTGKTMILHHIISELPGSVQPILIPYPDVEFIEILSYIARVLKIDIGGKGVLELTDEVKTLLTKASLKGRQVVLIIDEAHLLSLKSLENIRLLSNIEVTENNLLQILLIGQSELGLKLRKTEMRHLHQRINVSRILSPMNPSETIEYIDHRLKIAGSSFEKCFEQDCTKPLYQMTGGVPRSINRLCDTALLMCMIEKGEKVTERILKKAHGVIISGEIQTPKARLSGAFSNAFSYAKEFKPAFATAALILLLALGVLGYRQNLWERLNVWFYGLDAGKEVNTSVEKHKLPAFEERSRSSTHTGAGEDSSSSSLHGPENSPARSSAPISSKALPREAQTVNKTDETVKANDTVFPHGGEAGSSPAAPEKTVAEDRIPDKNTESAQPPVEGSGQVPAEERGTRDAAPQGPEKRTSAPSDFVIVTVQRGESLSKIAARWFPEDREAGIRSILGANPQIHDKNRILTGQTLRLPRHSGTEQ